MNPSEKGWLKKYLHTRQSNESIEKILSLADIPVFRHNKERFMYSLYQPTGLLYGHPVKFPLSGSEKIHKLDEKQKMRILMADSFLTSSLYLGKENIRDPHERKDAFETMIRDVTEYYMHAFPELTVKSKVSVFGRERKDIEQVESLINSRTEIKTKWDKNFWTSFFHNSLLFLDLYFYISWKKRGKISRLTDLKKQHVESRIFILKVIAAAAYANKNIENEERKLFEYFLHSADLPADMEKKAARLIDEQLTLADIDITFVDSWIYKKYLLELAILTVWADKEFEESEADFIEKLSAKLGFSNEETAESLIAIESFVLENWQSIHYLQGKQTYKVVSDKFIQSMSGVLVFYKNSIIKEIHESRELMALLNKSITRELNEEEKEKVRQQLIDILKALPLFAIIALPGRTLTLPVLFKILPKSVLPSAFHE